MEVKARGDIVTVSSS